jgi:hypothetical protein
VSGAAVAHPTTLPHPRTATVQPPMHHRSPAALLTRVAQTKETDMSMLVLDVAREARARDLAAARNARLVHALRKRRASERSQERARRLVRIASLAAQRSEASAWSGALTVAR